MKILSLKNSIKYKMRKILLIIVFFNLSNILCMAQINLVPNGSFELNDTCPTYLGAITLVTDWYSPTRINADYFAPCDSSSVTPPYFRYQMYQLPKERSSYEATANGLKYSKMKYPINIITDTSGIKYVANNIIIRFNHNLINTNIAASKDIQFTTLGELLPDSTVNNISTKLGISSVANWQVSKVYKSMTMADSISISRNGIPRPVDKLWSVYLLHIPAEIQPNIKNYIDNLKTLKYEIVYAELNIIAQK